MIIEMCLIQPHSIYEQMHGSEVWSREDVILFKYLVTLIKRETLELECCNYASNSSHNGTRVLPVRKPLFHVDRTDFRVRLA